jgi:hypothetical protein
VGSWAIFFTAPICRGFIDVEICVPCERLLTGRAHMNAGSLSEGPVAHTLHSGAYRTHRDQWPLESAPKTS